MVSPPATDATQHSGASFGALGRPSWLTFAWAGAIALAVGVRGWNALFGPMLHGYDGWAHITYVLFLDSFHALPWADQGWSFFHPPVYYLLGLALAQFGSADVLARGLACFSSLASLGIAWLIARIAASEGGLASLGAFCSVAFLPVHLYVSPMPGNEMTVAFFTTATLAVFIANERRTQKSRALDVAIGLLGALALLSKFNGALALGCVGVVGLVQAVRGTAGGTASRTQQLRQFAARAATIAAVVVLVAGPYYLRNVSEFGTPFKTSHDVEIVKAVEASQPPGERGLRDFTSFLSPSVFEDSSFDAPAVLHSVWGTLYLNLWFDTFRAGQFPLLSGSPDGVNGVRSFPIHRWTVGMAIVGLVPTLLMLFGAMRSARIVWADRSAVVDVVAWVLLIVGLTAFVVFALRVPTFAAVKASYFLNISLVWGWFSVRGVQGLARISSRAALRVVGISAAVVSVACVGVFTCGLLVPMSRDHADMQALRSYFGVPPSPHERATVPARDGSFEAIMRLAAIEMSHGNAGRAAQLWHKVSMADPKPQFLNALAAAIALDGRYLKALQIWNQLLRVSGSSGMPEVHSNRAALLALQGNLGAARQAAHVALAGIPDLAAGWRNLAAIEALAGNTEASAAASAREAALEVGAPRGFPHGIGDGGLDYALNGQRWLVVLGPGRTLELYRPLRSRIPQAPDTQPPPSSRVQPTQRVSPNAA